MSKSFREHITQEYEILWQLSKKKKIHPSLETLLKTHVQDAKQQHLEIMKRDKLEQKATEYPRENWAFEKLLRLEGRHGRTYKNKGVGIEAGEWISVEIECVLPNRKAEAIFVAFLRNNKMTDFVTLKEDGSLRESERECECSLPIKDNEKDRSYCECGAYNQVLREIVISFKYGDWVFVEKICAKLAEIGADVNRTCGLHVHFDCRNLTRMKVLVAGNKIAQTVPALRMLLPKSRRESQYCKLDINGIDGDGERYAFVNMHAWEKYKTIEVRGHGGTVEAEKIINWVKLLKTIMTAKKAKTQIEMVSELVNTFKFEPEVKEYILKRYEKFNRVKPAKEQIISTIDAVAVTVVYPEESVALDEIEAA